MNDFARPINKQEAEERRNLLLRMRYGVHLQQSHKESKAKLHVVGLAVVQSLRHPVVANIQALLYAQQHRQTVKKAMEERTFPEILMSQQGVLGSSAEVSKSNDVHSPSTSSYMVSMKNGGYKPSNLYGSERNYAKTSCQSKIKKKRAPCSKAVGSVSSGDFNQGESITSNRQIAIEVPNAERNRAEQLKQDGDCLHDETTAEGLEKTDLRTAYDEITLQNSKASSPRAGRRASLLRRSSQFIGDDSILLDEKTSYKLQSGKKRFSSKVKSKDSIRRMQNKENGRNTKSSLDNLEEMEQKTIRKFLEVPKSKPKHVCFDHPGVDLTYVDVRNAIEQVIPDAFENKRVISIQFENINVKLGTPARDNRWHIELKDFATRNILVKAGLTLTVPKRRTSGNLIVD